MLKRLPLLLIVLPVLAGAQSFDPHVSTVAGAGINWLGTLTQAVDDLTTATAPTLLGVGNILLFYIAAIRMIGMAIRWQVNVMDMFHHIHGIRAGEFYLLVMKIVGAEMMLTFYSTPLAGGISLHQLFPALFQQLTTTVNMQIVKTFIDQLQVFTTSLQLPGPLNIPGVITIFGSVLLIGLVQLGLFVVMAFGFVAVGMLTLIGPLMIPMFVSVRWESKFWTWVDAMIVYSSYRFLAACFSFVFAEVFMKFFNGAVNNDYSIGNLFALMAVFIPLSVAFVWGMFKVPAFATMVFGGVGSLGERFSSDVQSFVISRAGR